MIEPTIYKSKVYKSFIKELSKPPKIIVHPKNKTKEEIRKAGLVQKIINYQFKNNMKKKSFKKLVDILRMATLAVECGDDEAQKAYFENVEKLAEKELGHRVKPSWWDYIKNLFNS